MIELLIAFSAGFMGHQLEKPTRDWFGNGDMNRIASYTEGGLLILVTFALIAFQTMPRKDALVAVALLGLSMIGIGAGTVAGYIRDGDR